MLDGAADRGLLAIAIRRHEFQIDFAGFVVACCHFYHPFLAAWESFLCSALVPYALHLTLAFSRVFFNRVRDKSLIRLNSAHQSGYSGHNDKSCSLALRSTYFVSFAATCPGLPPATRASRPPLGDACVLTVSC